MVLNAFLGPLLVGAGILVALLIATLIVLALSVRALWRTRRPIRLDGGLEHLPPAEQLEHRLREAERQLADVFQLLPRYQESLTATQMAIEQLRSLVKDHDGTFDRHREQIHNIEQRLRFALRSVAVQRYNPFPDTGGNFSFVIAFVNEARDGVLLTGLHARETTRIFAKAIAAGRCETRLSPDEVAALERAIGQLEDNANA